jgi:hypothetical protein
MVLLLRVRQSCCHASLVPAECRERAQELYLEFVVNDGVPDPDEAVSVLDDLSEKLERVLPRSPVL